MEFGRAHRCIDNANIAQKKLVSKLQNHNVLSATVLLYVYWVRELESELLGSSELGSLNMKFNGTINDATVAENRPHYCFRVSWRRRTWKKPIKDSQRRGSDLYLL